MYDIITVGSATVDAFVDTGEKLFTKTSGEFVKIPFGSKIIIKNVTYSTGGGGTNSAVSLSRLGLKTAFLGKIGKGNNSERIIKELKKEKIDTSLISRGERTGFSIILNAKGHDRTILAFKGSNDNLTFNEIKKNKIKTKWFYFSSMLEKSFETQKKLAIFAQKNNIKIAYNPSIYITKKGPNYLKDILKRTTILVLNKEEAISLVGKKEIKNLLRGLYRLGPRIICITDAKKGDFTYDGTNFYYLQPHNIKVLERTGAGDSFASGFVAGMIKKKDIKFALQLGLANAESVIQYYGAKNKLLRMKEALKRIKNNPGKLKRL